MEANDWMILIALTFSFIFMSFFILEAVHGLGMPDDDIPLRVKQEQMKAFYLTIPFYNTALLCAKASILLQYHRVFPTPSMRLTCSIVLAALATYGTWAVISGFLNCIPVAKFWDPSIRGYCLDSEALWFSNASMHILTDIAILIIPIPALKGLRLPLRQRVGIIGIFALGGFVCITSIIRLISLKKIADSTDPTYDNVGAATWSAIECNTGIICACLPTLRPLLSKILPNFLASLAPRTRSLNTVTFPPVHIDVHQRVQVEASARVAACLSDETRLTHTEHVDRDRDRDRGDDDDDDDDESAVTLVQHHKGVGCRLSKDSNGVMTTTTTTLRSEDRYRSSVSSGPTVSHKQFT